MRLSESVSFKTTINAITAALESPVTQVYATMTDMASRYFAEKETMKGFQLAASSVGSKWFQLFYVNKLQGDLFDLVKYYPRQTDDLRALLSSRPSSFGELSKELPDILIDLSNKINMPSVKQNATRWKTDRIAYMKHLAKIKEQEAELANELDADRSSDKSSNDRITGQQNSQIEGIVSSVLDRLPRKVAAEIRQAIARKPDKLQALQQELASRKINLNEYANFNMKSALNEIASGIRLREHLLQPEQDPFLLEMESAIAEMQAELNEGNFAKSTLAAVPNMRIHPDLDNSSPYKAYRYGVAMAGNPTGNADPAGPIGQKMITIGFTPAEDEIIKATDRSMKSKSKQVSTKGSSETAENKVSPVAKIKRNKYGV
jgi:hypothetical protein